MPNGEERIAVMLPPPLEGEEEIPLEYFMTIQNKSTKNTYIFAEREDVSIGEAGWEPGRGRLKPEQNGAGTAIRPPNKKRTPTLTGTVHVCRNFLSHLAIVDEWLSMSAILHHVWILLHTAL